MDWEINKEEEQIRRTRTKNGMEEKKYGAKKRKKESANTIIEAKDGWMRGLLKKRKRE